MVRALRVFSTLCFFFAGYLFILSLVQILQGTPSTKEDLCIPSRERLKQRSYTSNKRQEGVFPLVKQAEIFALYLNPPQTQESKNTLISKSRQMKSISNSTSLETTPKFKLLATIHYRLKPEESMALVSEPGSGTHWIKRGEHLGHFVIENIKRGIVIYRNGDQLGEVVVDKRIPVHVERVPQITLASVPKKLSSSKSSKASISNRNNGKLLRKLGLPRPIIQPIKFGLGAKDNGR